MSLKAQQQQRNNLLYAKSIFFVNTLSSVGWTRFQNNFYLDNGLTAFEIGSLKSIGLFLKIFGDPFWSTIADLTNPKAVYILCTIVQVLTMEALRNVKPLTVSFVFYIKVFRTITTTGGNLVTAASFQLTEGTNEGYGRQRMFGAIAWGLGAYLAGNLIDIYGMVSLFFYTYFFVALTLILIIFGFPSKKKTLAASPTDTSKNESSIFMKSYLNVVSYLALLSKFLNNGPCRVVLLISIAYGACMTVPDTFLYISLERDFHATRSFTGWLTIVSVLSEVPIFWYSDYVILKIGHFYMKNIAIIACILRLLLLTMVPADHIYALHMILSLQLIHGVTFGMFWVAAADAIYKVAPESLLTSSVAALNMAYFTLGGTIGNYFWGCIYEYTGGVTVVYQSAAGVLVVVLLLFRRSETVLRNGLLGTTITEESEVEHLIDP